MSKIENAIFHFLSACEEGNGATASALEQQEDFTPALIRYGLLKFLANGQYDSATSLLAKSDAIDSNTGKPERRFVEAAVQQAQFKDTTGTVLFLNSVGASYAAIDLLSVWHDKEALMQMIDGGQYDIEKEGATGLLYAAASGQKDAFEALMKAGADPRKAIVEGNNDPRWDGSYSRIAEYAQEVIAKNPALAEKESTPVTLASAAHMKEARLSPGHRG